VQILDNDSDEEQEEEEEEGNLGKKGPRNAQVWVKVWSPLILSAYYIINIPA
jgi:hypothetical protein